MIIDSHCHLQLIDRSERRLVLQRSQQAGVSQWVVPAYQPQDWSLLDILESADGISIAKGVHPWVANLFNQDVALQLAASLDDCCAVGETGLDGGDNRPSEQQQLEAFDYQLQLASERQLPVIVHAHKAHNGVVRQIKKAPAVKGVIHAFAGSYQQAMTYIDLGFKLGVGGVISYERAQKTRNALAKVPLQSLLLETDSPSMPLEGHQGEPNEPRYCLNVAKQLAILRDQPLETIVEQTTKNTTQLFNL